MGHRFNESLRRLLVCASLCLAITSPGADSPAGVFKGEIVHSGGVPGYWMERCLVAEDGEILLGLAAYYDSTEPSKTPLPKAAEVGKLVHLRRSQSGWLTSPVESVAYRLHDTAVCKDTIATVGLEPVTATLNNVVIIGQRRGESRPLWKRQLRIEAIEPYRASVVALGEGEMLVVVCGRPAGANAAQTRGDVALLTKMTTGGSELWQRRIISDDAVFVSHVGFEAGEISMTGGTRGQTFERWSGLKPKMARNWGFEAGFSADSGQAIRFRQVLATESASVRKVLRMPETGVTLIGGNFSGTLQGVVPAVTNVGKGSTAYLVASSGSGEQLRSVLNPVCEERLADLVMVGKHCYALLLQIETGMAGLGAPRLSSRRLILRGFSADGETVGEREIASSQLGWFKGGLTLAEHEKGLIVAFSCEAQCQVLGKSFSTLPMTEKFFVLSIPPF